jgi:hypothetical protein
MRGRNIDDQGMSSSAGGIKEVRITVRLSAGEFERLKRAAEAREITIGAMVRALIRRFLPDVSVSVE